MRAFPGWRPLAGIVATAVLCGAYAHGGAAWPLGFIVLVPWLLALDGARSAMRAALGAWAMSIAFVAAVFAWFGFAIAAYIGIDTTTGLLVLLAAAPLLQPQFIVFALVRHWAGRRYGPVLRVLAGAAAWVATEWLARKFLGDTLGHGLQGSRLLRQVADVGGAASITFLLILANEAVAYAIAHRRDSARAWLRPLALAACVPLAMAGYGALRLSMLASASDPAAEPLRIGMVQSNIVDYERLRREMGGTGAVVRHLLDTHYAMSHEAVVRDRVDALLWSETAYPTTFGKPKSEAAAELDREIADFVMAIGTPLVFGTYDRDADGEYVAAAFIDPASVGSAQGLLGFYRKTNPFPLTEYVPPWLDGPTLRRALPWAGTWRPGDGARVLPLRLADGREIPVQPLICLDDTDSSLAIDGARLGAQLLLGMSNDAWFTRYPQGAELHLAVATFRSIETRLPQLRVTNNGISAAIDASGEVIARTAMGERTLLIGEATPAQPTPTPVVVLGDWVGRAALLGLILLLLWPLAATAWRRAATTAAPAQAGAYRARAALLTPAWRFAAAALRLFARGAALWLLVQALRFADGEQHNALTTIELFAALVLAPEAAAWAILRACAAILRIDDGLLVLEQRERRIEIPLREIAGATPWALPMPNAGLWLRLASGRRWSHGVAVDDPAALIEALLRAGASPALAEASHGRAAADAHTFAHARAQARAGRGRLGRRLDHPAVKFVLFALVPALPAFRLHQHIAYGGSFGEYYSFGLQAYLTALGIWWASWAINLVLYAAALRVAIEAGAVLALALRPQRATEVRRGLEVLGRLSFYLGVPLWLLLRLRPW